MSRNCILCLSAALLAAAQALGQSPAIAIRECTPDDVGKLLNEAKGAVTIFHFYASWCKPCREEVPGLVRVCERYKNHPFQMLAFSVDEDKYIPDLKRFLAAQKVNFEHRRIPLSAETVSAMRAFGMKYTGSIPYTAIFDPSGKLITQWPGAKAYGSYVTLLDGAFLNTPPTQAVDPPPAPAPEPKVAVAEKTPVPVAVKQPKQAKQKEKVSSGPPIVAGALVLLGIAAIAAVVGYFVYQRRGKTVRQPVGEFSV